MEINMIVKEVVKLVTVKRVQEIAIWSHDTDVLLLDGTCENYAWGCSPYQMRELAETLETLFKGAGYYAVFSGCNVSWERVHLIITSDSEIYKNFVESTPSPNHLVKEYRKYRMTYIANAPYGYSDYADVGTPYFHR